MTHRYFLGVPVIATTAADKGRDMMRKQPRTLMLRSALLATTAALVLVAGCDSESSDELRAGELLFDLTPEQVETIHATYLADEDLAETQAKLTAPFDCGLYGDLCDQVGREEAIDITARQVDLALEGVSAEAMEAQLREWIDAAVQAKAEAEDGESVEEFRSNGGWSIRTKGDYRLKVRNGITTPLIGQRQAWTESLLQHQDALGIWWAINGTQVCTNAGVNEQVQVTGGGGAPTSYVTIESYDPAKTCQASTSTLTITTYHQRNNGWENGGLWQYFTLTADGCGTADVNSVHLGICANSHTVAYY